MSDCIVIAFYICRRYGREDLLGKDSIDKAQLYEIIQRFAAKKQSKFKIIMQMLMKVKNNSE